MKKIFLLNARLFHLTRPSPRIAWRGADLGALNVEFRAEGGWQAA
jgi:hypothetical protein